MIEVGPLHITLIRFLVNKQLHEISYQVNTLTKCDLIFWATGKVVQTIVQSTDSWAIKNSKTRKTLSSFNSFLSFVVAVQDFKIETTSL